MASILRMSVGRAAVAIFERGFATSAAAMRDCGARQTCRQQPSWSATLQVSQFSKQAMGRPERGRELDSDSDSDSDSGKKEHRKEKGNSEFWRRKMRTFHGLIDLNRDGVVSYDDFKILAERFVNLGHLSTRQQEEFQAALKVVWEDQWGLAHPYNMVTTEQYLENMHHVINDRSLRSKAHEFLPHLFQAVDKDKRGMISEDDFKLFFECLGLGAQEAIESFKTIDINGDGFISAKEFVKLGRDYFLTEDESHPSKRFWGPLVNP